MTGRLQMHLLHRLRHEARLRAVEAAIARGILASRDPGTSSSSGGARLRVRRAAVEEDGYRMTFDVPSDDVLHRPIVLGALVEGRTRNEAATILKRLGVAMQPSLSSPSAHPGRTNSPFTVDELLRAVQANAVPRADEVAVLLLLMDAIERADIAEEDLRQVLHRRSWVATVLSGVDGFALRLIRMLKEGCFGHSVAIFDGYELRPDTTTLPTRFERGRSIILFRSRDEDSRGGADRDEKAAFAVRLGVPVLGVAEHQDELPVRLRRAADLRLETGPLTAALLNAVLTEVLGVSPGGVPGMLPDNLCRHLSIHDLSAAVRPALGITDVMAALRRLAGADDAAGTDKNRIGRVDGSAKRSAKSDSSASDMTRGRNSRTVSSGSEFIEPLAAGPGDAPAAPTVETLHGYGDARAWARNLKEDLALWSTGTLPWSQMSTKLLLSGPPGTGKTTFARALCNTLKVPLVATSVSTWLEPSHLGDVIKRMRLTFEEAQSHAPCIVFIDEIDGIGRRGEKNEYDDYWNAIINKLLELLDGATKSEGLIIVGATNHPGVIDPAIRRSGRLETHVEIPLPDVDALVGILAHHLGRDLDDLIAPRPDPEPTPGAEDERSRSSAAFSHPNHHPRETETASADL